MDVLSPVDGFEGLPQLDAVPQAVLFHPGRLRLDEVAETDPFDEFHDEELFIVGGHAAFERLDDVGMPQAE